MPGYTFAARCVDDANRDAEFSLELHGHLPRYAIRATARCPGTNDGDRSGWIRFRSLASDDKRKHEGDHRNVFQRPPSGHRRVGVADVTVPFPGVNHRLSIQRRAIGPILRFSFSQSYPCLDCNATVKPSRYLIQARSGCRCIDPSPGTTSFDTSVAQLRGVAILRWGWRQLVAR